MITILPGNSIRGTASDNFKKFPVYSLKEALERAWDTDAHFLSYDFGDPFEHVPRVAKPDIVYGTGYVQKLDKTIKINVLSLDIDCPEAHKTGKEADQKWQNSQLALLANSPHSSTMLYYQTRGGYRLLWQLAEPMTPQQADETLESLYGHFKDLGVEADPKALHWFQLMRLPKATREGKAQNYPVRLKNLGKTLDLDALQPSIYKGIAQASKPFVQNQIVSTGSRNDTLYKLASKLRGLGKSQQELVDAVTDYNTQYCQPPLPAADIATICQSASQHKPNIVPAPGLPVLPDDTDPTIRDAVLAKLEGSGERIKVVGGVVYIYNSLSGCWDSQPEFFIDNAVSDFNLALYQVGKDQKILKLRAGRIDGITKLVVKRRTDNEFWQEIPPGVLFNNGFLDASCQLQPTDPNQKQRFSIGGDFKAGQTPTLFIQTLTECWYGQPEVNQRIQLFREWLGATLLGLATKFGKMLFLTGEGNNGKSVILDICKAVVPKGAVQGVPPQHFHLQDRLALLASAKLNVVSELPDSALRDSDNFKSLLTGDLMTARQLYHQAFTFTPSAGHIVAANNLPAVRDTSLGMWRRVLVLPFSRIFAPHEQDKNRASDIINNELVQIASWAIEAVPALVKRGHFDIPKSVEQATEEWQIASDTVTVFLRDAAETDKNAWIQAAALYREYQRFTASLGESAVSMTAFGKTLSRQNIQKSRRQEGRGYHIKLVK